MRIVLLRQVSITTAVTLAAAAGGAIWWCLHRYGPPSAAQAADWVRNPLTPWTVQAALLSAAAVIAAFAFSAGIRITLLACAARHDRRQFRLRLRPPTLARSVTAALVGTAGVAGLGDPATALAASAGVTATDAEPDSGKDDRAQPDPDHLPAAPATRSARNAEGSTGSISPRGARPPAYQVKQADWLGRIAERYLGSFDRYPEIQQLNAHLITNADHIEPTWRLVLPADAHDRGARSHAMGRLEAAQSEKTPNSPEGGATGPDASPTPRQPDPGNPSEPTPQKPSDTAARPPSSAATSLPAAGGTASSGQPGPVPSQPRRRDAGVPLPGGWIGLPLAAALVAAGTMVWLQRRHRYIPQPIHQVLADNTDLRPLPPVMTHIRRAVRQHAPQLLEPTTTASPTVADHLATSPKQRSPQPPVGRSGPELAGLRHPLPISGLGLVGPGAEPAARALLIATLSSGGPTDPDAKSQIVIPAATLSTLLGATEASPGTIPRLHVAADLGEALARVDELTIERSRLVEDYDAADLASVQMADPFHPPTPPVLLLADAATHEFRARLTTTFQLGAPLGIGGVLLGDWPPGDTLTVHADGTVENGHDRLAVLDHPTAIDLLQVLREAHTGECAGSTHTRSSDGPIRTNDDSGSAGTRALEIHTAQHTSDNASAPLAPPSDMPAPLADPSKSASNGRASTQPPARKAASARRRVRIQLLGTPVIFDQDDHPVPGLRHHARELLVYLAVRRGGADLSQIMEAFWPDATVPRARERLSTEVGDLRRRIRLAHGDKAIQPVINTGGRYHLDPDLVEIDIWQLLDWLRRASSTADRDTRAGLLRQAIDVHTGILALGYDYDWIEEAREQIRRHGVRARTQLADLTADTDPTTAAELIRGAAALEPINEALARRAMRALAHSGDFDGVQAVFHAVKVALDDIGEEPSAETSSLAATLHHAHATGGNASSTQHQ